MESFIGDRIAWRFTLTISYLHYVLQYKCNPRFDDILDRPCMISLGHFRTYAMEYLSRLLMTILENPIERLKNVML